jgi:hypothetical protein
MTVPESLVTGHPGELRHCLRPDCDESFNIVAVFTGEAGAQGWRLLQFFGAVYICPVHAAPCINGHAPSWLDRDAVPGMNGIACSCGWQWQPLRPANMGEHKAEWVAHLMAADTKESDHA